MGGQLHFETPTATQYFAALVADDATLPVLEAAVALAQDDEPELDVQGVLATIDALCEHLRRRVPADAAPLQRLRLLNHFFFQEMGFRGNVNHYDDRRNNLLHAVLETRRGVPITLAILYTELAQQIGLRAQGVSFPDHFLVKVHMPRGEVVIDPFSGQSLGRDDLEERLLPYRHRAGLVGDHDVPLGLFLQAAPRREVLARLLRNLKHVDFQAQDWPRLAAVMQRLVILLPQAWEEHRDHALVLARLGRHALAASELALYLQHHAQAADAAGLRQQLATWGQPRP
jgi:regulator of sirC expression with transglutaminase-like and TPR domain